MIVDRYELQISTNSQKARDLYIAAVDLLLEGQAGIAEAFSEVIAEDPAFVLAHVGLARGYQLAAQMDAARIAMKGARDAAGALDAREKSHLNAMGLLIDGKTPQAYAAIRAHVDAYPRDALVAQTCSSVFGLIGFSGQPGREAEILAYTAALLPHYGDDWWCQSQYAFALCETGAPAKAARFIDRSMAQNPRNANGAHVRSHVYYETGETSLGLSYLTDWLASYSRSGYLHGHLSWHAALWSLEQGDDETMWRRINSDVRPGASEGAPINILTDTASILYRAELAGITVPPQQWMAVSEYAAQFFPKASLGFIDVHAALAHAMAGNAEGVAELVEHPNGLTGDLVGPVALAYAALAQSRWAEAVQLLVSAMADHARLGGSRAQRDLLELSLLGALLKLGKDDEARHLLTMRRPVLAGTRSAHGLSAH